MNKQRLYFTHTRDAYGFKEGAKNFPLMVVVAMSYVCNARCPNCPYTQSTIRQSYKDRPFIRPETFKRIADECGRFRSYMRLSGGGEPFLLPYLITLIEYAKSAGAKVGIITNGSRLTPRVASRLLAADTDTIEVSVDAADKETYSRIRVGLDFDALVASVMYLREERDVTRSKTRIVASVVNQKALGDKLSDTVAFWAKIVDKVQVRKFLTWSIGDSKQSADPSPYLSERVPCPFPFERLNIDTRGDIAFCGYDIVGETNFGNVHETSIEAVWKGEKFNAWRKLLLEGRYEEIPVCQKCSDWRYRSWNYNYWKVLNDADGMRDE